ncbi:MAG: type II toxin-antitoxin system RelE/ParE family toxin [Faecalibacterium sp.]
MYKLQVTHQAAEELERITDYIAVQLDSPGAALDWLLEVDKHYERLENTPYMYEACHDAILRRKGYRRIVIRNYILVYKIAELEKTVQILHFFHGTQNYEMLI